jgi:site-specific recombinase XerD
MRTPPHPLEQALQARVQWLATVLRPATIVQYRHTAKVFLGWLRTAFPDVRHASELRRDPHILGFIQYIWMWRIRGSDKPLCHPTRAAHLLRLRKLFELLADHRFPPRPGLLLGEDIPRRDQRLPRPLTPEDDARLLAELRRRNDLLAAALLLTRLTGIRIGETIDLSPDCLRHLGDGQWALHVPVGKLHNERWTPVDQEVCAVVARLRFLRTLPPAAPPEFLLPRPKGRVQMAQQLRATLRDTATQAGITAHIVPHQLRHTYATSMLRAGLSLPALMKMLGHRTASMTLLYVEITQNDLQREFHMAQQKPRHLLPLPPALHPDAPITGAAAVSSHLAAAIRTMELFRQHSATAENDKPLRLLHRRLVRIHSRFKSLDSNSRP